MKKEKRTNKMKARQDYTRKKIEEERGRKTREVK